MKPLQCIIIEDEPLASEILEDYLRQLPQLELMASFPDALFALEFLQREKVDVIFLDLHLPKLKGFDFLKTLSHPPQVIVTTAYNQYALQGYDLQVVDYLMKPIEFGRLLKAVNKLKYPNPSKAIPRPEKELQKRRYTFFNVNKKKLKVYIDEIQYIESLREYVRIHLLENSIVTKYQIGELEILLAEEQFLRIHRSYLVARSKITAYTPTTIEVNDMELPIGRSYKHLVSKVLDEN